MPTLTPMIALLAPVVALVLAGSSPSTLEESVSAPGGIRSAAQPSRAYVSDRLPRGNGPETARGRGTTSTARRATPRSLLGTGQLTVVRGRSRRVGTSPARLFAVQVERGLGVDRDAFVRQVERALFDRRSWSRGGSFGLRRTGEIARAELTVILASPETTDRLCAPLQTNGVFSCSQGSRAVLNAARWRDGATSFAGDLVGYRRYLVNHEVGHVLRHAHRGCPAAGAPAPVMMQQSKGVGSCTPNPWPFNGAN